MDAKTTLQLQHLAELCRVFKVVGVDWWLFGGWAVDFNLGRISRAHDDIEVYVWERDVEAVKDALVSVGYEAPPALHPNEGQPFTKNGEELGVWFLTMDDRGRPMMRGRWADWRLPDGAFEQTPLMLGTIEARALSPDALIEMKVNFPRYANDAALREKDQADIALLRSLIGKRG